MSIVARLFPGVVGLGFALTAGAGPSQEQWSREIPGHRGEPVTIMASKETVYVLSERAVTAFRSSDGTLQFQFLHSKGSPTVVGRYGHFFRLAALLPDGLVASRGDGSVMAWRAGGAPKFIWRSSLKGGRVSWPLVAVQGERCVIADPGWNGVVAVQVDSGTVLWERELPAACTDLATGEGWAAMVTVSGMTMVSLVTGEALAEWKLPPGHQAVTAAEQSVAVVGQGGAVAVMRGWAWMNHRKPDKGPLAMDWSWVNQETEWAELTPGAVGGGMVVAASHGVPSVVALSLSDGSPAWVHRDEGVVYWSAPVVSSGHVLVSTGTEVRVLDVSTGALKETLAPADPVRPVGTWANPVAVEGAQVFAAWGGRVTKFLWRPTFDKSLTIPLQKGQP